MSRENIVSMPELDPEESFTVVELEAYKNRAAVIRKRLGMKMPAFISWAEEILERPLPQSKFYLPFKSDWETILSEMESKGGPPESPQPSCFSFNLDDWRRAATLSRDFVPPDDVLIEMVVDPSYIAKEGNDSTGLAVGFKATDPEIDDLVVTLLYSKAGQWKGWDLPQAIAETAIKHNVDVIKIEYTQNGACDLLVDNVRSLTEIPIEAFEPLKVLLAKALRIKRL
jgi:hypothetical protein